MAKDSNIIKVFSSYSATLRRCISRFVRPHDIDDIVQETFIKSYQADLKETIEYPKSYMLKTAKNLAQNHLAKWDNKYSDSLDNLSEFPTSLSSLPFEQQYETKERFLLFCQSVEQLSGSVRKCFILKKVYGLSQKEIAQHLGLSQSTVEKHVAKGLLLSMQYLKQKDQQAKNLDANHQSINLKQNT